MLTILAALNDEIRLIRSDMNVDKAIHVRPVSIYIGEYENKKIALVKTGVGKKAMAKAASYCIKNLKPTLFLNIGYAGGLDPHLHAGDITIASSVIEESTEKSWKSDDELVEAAKHVSNTAGLKTFIGGMVMVDKALADPHEKAFAGTRFEAIACDMESAGLAEAASGSGVPFLVVRAVLDPMDIALPDLPENAIIGGEVKIGAIISHLKAKPKELLKLPKFSYLANQARIALTDFVKAWVKNET